MTKKVALARGVRSRIIYAAVPFIYRYIDAIAVVDKGVGEDLVRFASIDASKISIIHNPVVDETIFESAKVSIDHPWFGPSSAPVILAAGRLHTQKGFDTLIKAFSLVRRKTAVRLLIIGEGGERSKLQALANSLGVSNDVEMPGFVPNPYSYMSKANLFVLSSRWEGLPTVLIEAMACGVPIVATDCPSGPREILQGGRLGPLIEVDDVTALASAIAANLDKPHGTGIERAKDFSVPLSVAAHLKLLEA